MVHLLRYRLGAFHVSILQDESVLEAMAEHRLGSLRQIFRRLGIHQSHSEIYGRF